MRKKELVAMFLESPFYFDLTLQERLFLLNDHRRRFGPDRKNREGLARQPVAPPCLLSKENNSN
jgi:hypothetical protein